MHITELQALELSVILYIVQVLVQTIFAQGEFGVPYLMSPRDEGRKVTGVYAGRAERALDNLVQHYAAFVGLDVALIATGHTGGIGAMLWIIGRVLQFIVYLAGIPGLRTLCWALSIAGLIMMLLRLAGMATI